MKVIRNKDELYIMIMESILQEDIIIPNVYMPKNRVKIHRQKLIELQREIDDSTTIVRETSIHLYQQWTDKEGRK